MKKLKIGIVTPTFPPKGGGIATAHYNIYQILKDTYDVRVFAYNDIREKSENEIIKRKTPQWIIPFINWFVRLYLLRFGHNSDKFNNSQRIYKHSIGAWMLNRPIKNFNPDILIVPDNNVPLRWLNKGNFKIAWFTRNNYLRFRDNPLLTGNFWLDIDIARSVERKALNKVDAILSPSKYMIEEYYRAYSQPLKIHVINNFIFEENLKKILTGRKGEIDSEYPIVFMPSAGTVIKGSRYTYEIIRRISESCDNKVAFYISGSITKELKFELSHLHHDVKVFSNGHTSWESNLLALNQSHLMVSATLGENFSNAFVEAFILGKPLVTFDVGGNKEIVDDGINGYVVPYLDVNQLVGRATDLIKDIPKYNQFSIEARKKGLEFSQPKRILGQYSKVFNEILETSG